MDDATVPRAAPRGSYLGWRAQRLMIGDSSRVELA
jgi:hypothetical protein